MTRTVHPRACGEHFSVRGFAASGCGSSPRLRGTPFYGRTARTGRRFIPAPAGNTARRSSSFAGRSVHPRACGEHILPTSSRPLAFGSSPRLRGTPARPRAAVRPNRFIPAPAGNTPRFPGKRVVYAVHPRACGEHRGESRLGALQGGSSPRLRGTRDLRYQRLRCGRFIPAPAGNTGAALGAH